MKTNYYVATEALTNVKSFYEGKTGDVFDNNTPADFLASSANNANLNAVETVKLIKKAIDVVGADTLFSSDITPETAILALSQVKRATR